MSDRTTGEKDTGSHRSSDTNDKDEARASGGESSSGSKGEGRGSGRKQNQQGGDTQEAAGGKQKSTGEGTQKSSQESEQQGDSGPTRTEWVVGIGSAMLVLALVGFVIYESYNATQTPPIVALRVERILPVSGGYVVEVGVYNEGGSTAKSLTIEGTLKRDTVTVETSTASVSYVPAETEREAGLFFTKDPRQYKLEVRPMGYDRP